MPDLDTTQSILTSAAIVAAGLWAFFHYLRRRTYKLSVELTLAGDVIVDGNNRYLLASVSLHNLGLSKLDLQQRGTGLRVFGYPTSWPDDRPQFAGLRPSHLGTVPVFRNHKWLEPNETVRDEWLFLVPSNFAFFALGVRVVSKRLTWATHKILHLSPTKPSESID